MRRPGCYVVTVAYFVEIDPVKGEDARDAADYVLKNLVLASRAEIERLRAADALGVGALAALAIKNRELAEQEHARAEAAEAKLAEAQNTECVLDELAKENWATVLRREAELAAERAKTAEMRESNKALGIELVHWQRRAQEQDHALNTAEARTAKLVEALHQIADTPSLPSEPTALLLRKMATDTIQAAAKASEDWVSSAPQSIEGSTDAASGMGAADTGVMPGALVRDEPEEKPKP